jgi:ligand-binding SRPBCC domain-containing protein
MPSRRTLHTQVWLPRPVEDIFPFFADAANLNALTPDWLDFRIVTPLPIAMGEGTLIDYRIGLKGIPMRWRTRISAWQPPAGAASGAPVARFIDEQIKGPYALWRHEHVFEPQSRDGEPGTLCTDIVTYAHWGGPLAERWLVRPDLDRIFAYRQDRMRALFARA